MREKEEIIAELDSLLKQNEELQEKIKETKKELADASDAEMKRLQKQLKSFSTTEKEE